MNTVCLIPARGGSRRVARKNLVDLCGKPLVAWSIEAALEADVGPVYVSTDDDEIAEAAEGCHAYVHRRRMQAASDRAGAEAVLDDFVDVNGPARILYAEPSWPLRTPEMFRNLHARANRYGNTFAVEESDRRLWDSGKMCGKPLLGCGMFCVQWAASTFHDGSGMEPTTIRIGPLLSELWWERIVMDGPPGWNIDVNHPWDLAAARDAMERRLRGTA